MKASVCEQFVRNLHDPLDYIQVNSKLMPVEACGLLFTTRCGPNVQWKLQMPAKKGSKVTRKREATRSNPTKIRTYAESLSTLDSWDNVSISNASWQKGHFFVHLTDINLDVEYKEGSSTVCDEPLCCHGPIVQGSNASGHWADARSCDMGPRLLQEAVRQVHSKSGQARFWLMTGNVGSHHSWATGVDQVKKAIQVGTEQLKWTKKAIFPVLGNLDIFPVNGFSPPSVTDADISSRSC